MLGATRGENFLLSQIEQLGILSNLLKTGPKSHFQCGMVAFIDFENF
jgi:hypothetical protein